MRRTLLALLIILPATIYAQTQYYPPVAPGQVPLQYSNPGQVFLNGYATGAAARANAQPQTAYPSGMVEEAKLSEARLKVHKLDPYEASRADVIKFGLNPPPGKRAVIFAYSEFYCLNNKVLRDQQLRQWEKRHNAKGVITQVAATSPYGTQRVIALFVDWR